MADIEIQRAHGLGWAGAQSLAQAWQAQAESDWGMTCTHTPGEGEDRVTFERPGAQGLLRVDAAQFELQITLGFLLRAGLLLRAAGSCAPPREDPSPQLPWALLLGWA